MKLLVVLAAGVALAQNETQTLSGTTSGNTTGSNSLPIYASSAAGLSAVVAGVFFFSQRAARKQTHEPDVEKVVHPDIIDSYLESMENIDNYEEEPKNAQDLDITDANTQQ